MAKRAMILVAAAMLALCFAGCAQTTPGTGCIAPVQYESEEAFVEAVQEGNIPSEFNAEEIKCYYKPKDVPEGAVLNYIEVYYSYITFIYTFDIKNRTDVTIQLKYQWYRDFNNPEEFINSSIEKLGLKEVHIQNAKSGSIFISNDDFSAEKESKDQNERPNWYFFFVQDGQCFAGVVPWSIPEEEIGKYFVMEKVVMDA